MTDKTTTLLLSPETCNEKLFGVGAENLRVRTLVCLVRGGKNNVSWEDQGPYTVAALVRFVVRHPWLETVVLDWNQHNHRCTPFDLALAGRICRAFLEHPDFHPLESRARHVNFAMKEDVSNELLGLWIQLSPGLVILTLDFSRHRAVSSVTFQAFMDALRKANSLKSLSIGFDSSFLTVPIARIFGHYFEQQPAMDVLCLKDPRAMIEAHAMEAVESFVRGLQANTSIKELDWNLPIQSEAMRTFFRHCKTPKLILGASSGDNTLEPYLYSNQYLQDLTLKGYDWSCHSWASKIITTYDDPQHPAPHPFGTARQLRLQKITVKTARRLSNDETDICMRNLAKVITQPIPTLTVLRLDIGCAFFGANHLTTLLEALVSSKALVSFGLTFFARDVTECFSSVAERLPLLSHLTSLMIQVNPGNPWITDGRHELKNRLLEGAKLNTGLVSVRLEPWCQKCPDFKTEIQTICMRNKVSKAMAAYQDMSLPLKILPKIMENVQGDCREVGVSPKIHNASLLFAGLRAHARPELVGRIQDHFLQQGNSQEFDGKSS
jgi:hypothetical protein